MFRLTLLTLLVILLVPTHSEIQIINLPICPDTQYAVNYRINYLKLLLPTYNWLFCNKPMLYRAVVMASQILHRAAGEMKINKGNHVEGTNNRVLGYGNVVLGSNNELVGLKSWCFTSEYTTDAGTFDEGVLAIGNYKVQLSAASKILENPSEAISMIDDSELEKMKKQNVAISFFFQ